MIFLNILKTFNYNIIMTLCTDALYARDFKLCVTQFYYK